MSDTIHVTDVTVTKFILLPYEIKARQKTAHKELVKAALNNDIKALTQLYASGFLTLDKPLLHEVAYENPGDWGDGIAYQTEFLTYSLLRTCSFKAFSFLIKCGALLFPYEYLQKEKMQAYKEQNKKKLKEWQSLKTAGVLSFDNTPNSKISTWLEIPKNVNKDNRANTGLLRFEKEGRFLKDCTFTVNQDVLSELINDTEDLLVNFRRFRTDLDGIYGPTLSRSITHSEYLQYLMREPGQSQEKMGRYQAFLPKLQKLEAESKKCETA